jgi:hypothetical protein
VRTAVCVSLSKTFGIVVVDGVWLIAFRVVDMYVCMYLMYVCMCVCMYVCAVPGSCMLRSLLGDIRQHENDHNKPEREII